GIGQVAANLVALGLVLFEAALGLGHIGGAAGAAGGAGLNAIDQTLMGLNVVVGESVDAAQAHHIEMRLDRVETDILRILEHAEGGGTRAAELMIDFGGGGAAVI